MKNRIEHDPQLSELLKGSFVPRPKDEAEQLTRKIMRRLPRRRRRSVLALLLAYIQSPFWLVTLIILCLCIFVLNLGDMTERIDNPLNILVIVAIISFGAAIIASDMLRDVENMTARNI